MKKLPPGKIPVNILKEVVFKNLGVKRSEVAVGPSVGLDGAVIDVENKSLIISMDPITGAFKRIGYLSVYVNANDVATFGIQPTFFFSTILLPENSKKENLETICAQMNEAAQKLGMAIAGGHCETTPGLDNPVIVGCAMGVAEKGRYVTASGAKPGDKLILTKTAAIEGTAILATDLEKRVEKMLGQELVTRAKEFFSQISIVKEAVLAFHTGGVNAMHDPTEGGVLGGIHEMADASNLGVKIYEEKISIAEETLQICRAFKIDPLKLISSGTLLIAATPVKAEEIVNVLQKNGILASIIGEFLANSEERILIKKGKVRRQLVRPLSDHLWLALAKA